MRSATIQHDAPAVPQALSSADQILDKCARARLASFMIVVMGVLCGLALSAMTREPGAEGRFLMLERHGGGPAWQDPVGFAAPVFFYIVGYLHS